MALSLGLSGTRRNIHPLTCTYWSSIILYQLPPTTTIHGILPVQLTCLTVFFTTSDQVLFGLPLGLEPSTSYSVHFIHPVIVFFSQHMPIPSQLVLSLCHLFIVSQLFTWNSIFYLNVPHPCHHSHLCPLKSHLIFFPYRPGLTSIQHTTLHATAVLLFLSVIYLY